MHARPVCVEDPRHLDLEPVLPVVVEEEGLGAALALVIAGARADGIDVAPVTFGLRMNFGIAVDLAGRSLKDLAFEALGQPQHVDRAMHRGLGRLDRVVLVMHRRSRAGQIVDLVDLHVEREGHVMAHEFEAGMVVQVIDVALVASEKVIETQHLVTLRQQTIDQVRADEPRTPRHENAFATFIELRQIGPLSNRRSTWRPRANLIDGLTLGQCLILKQTVFKVVVRERVREDVEGFLGQRNKLSFGASLVLHR